MLILLFLTALLNKLIVCYEDSNESRYIDLLPEEEKEQFLERIARRILEDGYVKDNDNNHNKHSAEITDDQLNEHNEYVQKLLEEESENLRKNNADKHTKAENGEILLVKSDDKAEHYLEDERATTVMTVRKKRRDSFNTMNTDNDTYIKVEVQYDKENLDNENKDTQNPLSLILNENNKVHENETEKSIDKEADKSDTEDIQVKNIRSNFLEEHIDTEHVVVATDKNLDVSAFDDEIGENITEEVTTKKLYDDTTDDNFKEISRNLPTELETESKDILNNKTAVSSESVKNFDNAHIDKDTKEETVADVPTTVTSLGTTEISYGKTERNVSAVLRSSIDYKEISSNGDEQKTKESIHNDNTISKLQLTTENLLYKDLKTPNNDTSANKTDNISFNNTNQEILDVKNVDPESTFGTKKINTVSIRKTNGNKTNNDNITVANIDDGKDDIAKDFLKALRSNLLQSDLSNDNNRINSSKQINIKQNSEFTLKSKLKEYNVYEIPEDKPVFTQNSKTKKRENEEQPYYVPIYNYSPNNAYFNAQNRYGPNFDDSRLEKYSSDITNSEERSSDRSLNDYSQRKFNFAKSIDRKPKSTNKPKHSHAPLHVKRSMFPSVKPFVPGNYIDADYYFDTNDAPHLRSYFKDKPKRKLPASDEETHPFSNLNKVKSHIRAIRHILFEQKRLGYVNQMNSSDFKSADNDDYKETDTTTLFPTFKLKRERTKVDKSEENSISMDYYFGRLKSDSSSNEDTLAKKIGYIKDANNIQYVYLPSDTNKYNWYKVKPPNKDDNHLNTDLRIKKYRSSEKVNQSELYDPFDNIIDMTDEKDLLHVLEKLKALNMTKTRSNDASHVSDAYVEVMKDMVHLNSIALKQYDWLGTTVDIQAAIKKLQDLIKSHRNSEKIHPSDLQLLKYVIYLCVESKRLLQTEANTKDSNKELRNNLLPSIKKKQKNYLKDKGLINRVWLLRREGVFDFTTRELLILNNFFNDLQNALFALHEAIKNIASVTNVKNQRWFENIKELYLNDDRKQLLEIVLHLSATRLFDMIEEKSADIETNIEAFSKENKEVIRESIEEFKFVFILLKEIISLN